MHWICNVTNTGIIYVGNNYLWCLFFILCKKKELVYWCFYCSILRAAYVPFLRKHNLKYTFLGSLTSWDFLVFSFTLSSLDCKCHPCTSTNNEVQTMPQTCATLLKVVHFEITKHFLFSFQVLHLHFSPSLPLPWIAKRRKCKRWKIDLL